MEPWTKEQIEAAKKADVATIRAWDKRFAFLTNDEVARLWSWFSDVTRCAGWLIVDQSCKDEFVTWTFTRPFEAVQRQT